MGDAVEPEGLAKAAKALPLIEGSGVALGLHIDAVRVQPLCGDADTLPQDAAAQSPAVFARDDAADGDMLALHPAVQHTQVGGDAALLGAGCLAVRETEK